MVSFLRYKPTTPPDAKLLDQMRRHKSEIVELLRLQLFDTDATQLAGTTAVTGTTFGDTGENIEPRPVDTGCEAVAAAPVDRPCAKRRGVIRRHRARFEHYCATCGAWGAFGYDTNTGGARWFCKEHRPS